MLLVINFIHSLVLVTAFQSLAQFSQLKCAENKFEVTQSCQLKDSNNTNEILSEIADKCQEKVDHDLDSEYEAVARLSIKPITLTPKLLKEVILEIQDQINFYSKNLNHIEAPNKEINIEEKNALLLELNNIKDKYIQVQIETQKSYDQYKLNNDFEKKKILYDQFIEKKVSEKECQIQIEDIESKLDFKNTKSYFPVVENYKKETKDFIKLTINKLQKYKKLLETAFQKNELNNVNLIKDYYKAKGLLQVKLDELKMISRGENPPCNLTNTELILIKAYTGASYTMINSVLRSGPNDSNYEIVKKQADFISKGLDKIASYEGLVKRGVTSLPKSVQSEHCEGCIVQYSAFTSTSKGSGFQEDFRFVIKSKSGKHIAAVSNHPHEDEVLFKYGARFKILDVKKTGTITEYTMQELEE